MGNMKQRIEKLELARPASREEEDRECDRLLDERWAKEGTSREAIIAEYGSVGEWAHARIFSPSPSLTTGPYTMERYMAMLNG